MPDEQDRFVRAYVRHRPQFNVSTPKLGPQLPEGVASKPQAPLKRPPGPSSSISNFMLDARAPTPTDSMQAAEAESTAAENTEVARLLNETRMWRLANSAQWVAWGIVQAKVPGMPDFSRQSSADGTPKAVPGISASPEQMSTPTEESGVELQLNGSSHSGPSDTFKDEVEAMREDIAAKRPDAIEENNEAEEEEFDYLAYARDRAMFFWGDALNLGLVKEEELPADVLKSVKVIGY